MSHDPIPQANLCPEVIQPPQFDVKEWIDSVLAAMKNHPEMVTYIDSIPEALTKVGDTHVIVPHPDHMTEDMIDASRSLLLYTDTFSTNDVEYIRERITSRRWIRQHIPQWFREDKGHLTKAARAMLAYDLTVKAALYPPAPADKYFPETTQEKPTRPSKLGFELELFYEDHELSISRKFEDLWSMVTHGDMLDIQINRHQLPDNWKGLFKKNAIEISGRLVKTPGDGEIYLDEPKIRLGLKAQYADKVIQRFTKSIQLPETKRQRKPSAFFG